MMTGIAGDPGKWAVLLNLKPEFVRTLRCCCVFGKGEKEALLIDDEDNVWGLGSNTFGRLGIGDTKSCPNPVKVVALSGRAVKSFAYGEHHIIALTKKGVVYGWGNNEHGQVGRSELKKIYTPTLVYDRDDPAVEIACGNSHSACCTREGAVYVWGGIAGCLGRIRVITEPTKVTLNSDGKCIQISCLKSSTLAVDESGRVFILNPEIKQISDSNTIIRKIAGGIDHALAVSDDGSVYVWGSNSEGQLGLVDKTYKNMLARHSGLMETHGWIIEIAVSKYDNVSAVMTERLEVLVWGNSGEFRVPIPTKVACESLQDVFAMFSSVSATPVPMIMPSKFSEKMDSPCPASPSVSGWDSSILKTIAEHFNDPTSSDVKFRVGDETLYVHKTLLKIQSEYFKVMLDGPWEENQSDTIEVKTYSYPVYKAFLRYFYTGEVELPAAESLELLDLANSCCENRLKVICQKRIQSTISIADCASVYSTALRCGASDLENFCLNFAAKNLAAVARTSAFKALPDDVARKFLECAVQATGN